MEQQHTQLLDVRQGQRDGTMTNIQHSQVRQGLWALLPMSKGLQGGCRSKVISQKFQYIFSCA